jgi:benzodiazapine receptor
MEAPNLRQNDRVLTVCVMLATVVVIVVNFLAATGRINGVMPNEISDKDPTVITPAGWAFSIWSVIYAGLIGFSILQLMPSRRARFARARVPFLVSCLANCMWILFWHHFHIGMCAVVIALLAASLVWVNIALEKPVGAVETIFTKGVFGLYAGWVTVAMLVNFAVYLVSSGVETSIAAWDTIGILLLALALGITILVRIYLHNFMFPLAVAWAAAAIGANQSGNTPIVVATAVLCMAALIISGSVVTELKSTYP